LVLLVLQLRVYF